MPFQWTVTVGLIPWDCTNSMEMTYSVAKIIINPDSNSNVALVELVSELPYYIRPAQVNVYGYDFQPGAQCSVVSWNGMSWSECYIFRFIRFITQLSLDLSMTSEE